MHLKNTKLYNKQSIKKLNKGVLNFESTLYFKTVYYFKTISNKIIVLMNANIFSYTDIHELLTSFH